MVYSSRRPYWVPILSAKNRKLKLYFSQGHQSWTAVRLEKHWADVSQYLLRRLDGRVRIRYKQHESCSKYDRAVQACFGGVMMLRIFSLYTLGLLVPNEDHLNMADNNDSVPFF